MHGYLLSTYSCGIRVLAAMGVESGLCRLYFPRAQLLELWYAFLFIYLFILFIYFFLKLQKNL